MTETDGQPSRLGAAQRPPMRSLLGRAAQRLAFANDSVALLAALLLANSLRLHFPGWAVDLLFGVVTAFLGMSLFREGGIFAAAPQGRFRLPSGASKLLFTPLCFAALLALYGAGLVSNFSGQGLRNFAGLACIAVIFLFCHQNGSKLAQSRSAILLFLLSTLAVLPLYWSSADAHPVFLSVYLGYALLAIGILLAARCRSRNTQHLWVHAIFLAAAAVALAFGSRALMLAMLLALAFHWGAHRLLRRRGGALALAGGALALAGLVSTMLGSSRMQEALLNAGGLGWSYTGGTLDSGRRILFQASMSGILDAPWFGNGPAADVTKLAPNGNASFNPQEPYCLRWANPELLNDCGTLLKARSILAGTDLESLWTWDFYQPITNWVGVELGGSPLRVVGVNLAHSHLNGQIPPVLGELQQLSTLRLDHNYLSGPIPPELGKLRNLTILDLSQNHLTGPIPEKLGSLANLEELRLDHNRLSGDVPEALTALDKLRRISLNGNDFAAPPPLALHSIQHDFHDSLFCLPPLWKFPHLLQDCTALLEARDTLAGGGRLNWRHSLPIDQWWGVELGERPVRIVGLHLSKAGLVGRIPAQIAALESLVHLHLQDNHLKGAIPAELALLPRLKVLRLAGNEFNAPVPAELWDTPDHDLGADLYCASGPHIGPGLLKDCTTLLAIQGALAGGGRLDWRKSAPIGWWKGIAIEGDPPRVQSLHLGDNGLSGQIPPELGQLDQLVQLHLHNNELTGPIPTELAKLQNLESLLLSNNTLSGTPPPLLAALSNLRQLDLHGNDFANGVPQALRESADRNLHRNWFCPMSAQAGLGLVADCNLLLAVRDTFGNGALNWRRHRPLGAWQGVRVGGSPARVQALRLRGVELSGRIPPELGQLTKLDSLFLSNSALKGAIPPQLGNLRNLRVLRLRHNRLTGAIPPELGALPSLEVLDLRTNHLVGAIPPQLGNLRNLRALHLQRNRLTGAIPPELGALPSLEVLDLRTNHLVGAIPPELGTPLDLENPQPVLAPAALQADEGAAGLELLCQELADGNPGLQGDCDLLLAMRDRLAGSAILNWARTTPVRFWQGVTLGGTPLRVTALDLSRWGVDGVIPSELGGLEQLISLRLQRNALTGAIPPALGQLAHLEELLLSGNALTGSIPRQLGRLGRLTALHLRHNHLQGAIPAELGELTSLRTLALDGNDLTGPIPAELGDLLDLEELLVGNNRLREAIPARVLALPQLSVLWSDAPPAGSALEEGQLVDAGESPSQAKLFCSPHLGVGLHKDCTTLLERRDILAGDADLNWRPSVPISAWRGVTIGGHPPRITAIGLPYANLSGRIPARLSRLQQLRSLRLEGNQLTGKIPARLARLNHLEVLTLDGNKLTDAVPLDLSYLPRLRQLGLSNNRLVGSVTKTLEKMDFSSWRQLNLGGNDFTDCLTPELHGLADRRLELDLRCDPSPWSKPRLLEDAAVLMGIKSILAGDVELNWRYNRPLRSWQGVSIGGRPMRVAALDLSRMGLNGSIPPQLATLDALVHLQLNDNRLTGAIPPELGRLMDLRTLRLDGNALAGSIPKQLENLHRLRDVRLEGNRLTGCLSDVRTSPLRSSLSLNQHPLCDPWTDKIRPVGRQIHRLNSLLNPTTKPRLAESSHNLFLHIGLQSGLVGLGAAALLCLSLIFNLRRRGEGQVTPVQCFTAASAFTAIFYSAFEVFLLQHFLSAAVFAWAAIGIGTGLHDGCAGKPRLPQRGHQE